MQPVNPLYLAADPLEAHLLRDFLAERGIAVDLLDLHLWGGRGDLPVNLSPRVHLRDPRQRAAALAALAEWKRRGSGVDWHCSCGEPVPDTFECCWACGRQRP